MAAALKSYYGQECPVKVLALMNGALWFAADVLRLGTAEVRKAVVVDKPGGRQVA